MPVLDGFSISPVSSWNDGCTGCTVHTHASAEKGLLAYHIHQTSPNPEFEWYVRPFFIRVSSSLSNRIQRGAALLWCSFDNTEIKRLRVSQGRWDRRLVDMSVSIDKWWWQWWYSTPRWCYPNILGLKLQTKQALWAGTNGSMIPNPRNLGDPTLDGGLQRLALATGTWAQKIHSIPTSSPCH